MCLHYLCPILDHEGFKTANHKLFSFVMPLPSPILITDAPEVLF